MYPVKRVAKSFGSPKRVKLLSCLADGRKHVGYLHRECDLSQSAVSQHLKQLHEAGLVTKSREQKRVYYQLQNDLVAETADNIHKLSKIIT